MKIWQILLVASLAALISCTGEERGYDLTPPWAGKLLELNYSNPQTLEPKELGFHPEGKSTGGVLNLWNYRRIINKNNFEPGTYDGDITIVNWPQNDYFLGDVIDVSEKEFKKHIETARQLNLSLFHWLQTEAPRPDGGTGWPGLRLRSDVMGTTDGMAKYPYIRESRRIRVC
ncbi:FAD-dependent oxidoreductase [Tangfeifania diversioriginum]|uniref:FAD-dependent oxidoreductase n=1 Tax=Tangfeifania diversioriginum TaxID=1168035 RepID=UPI000934E8B1|nr:FAD-dependent oxidoreductase [Tangfeifania diversioriginum]